MKGNLGPECSLVLMPRKKKRETISTTCNIVCFYVEYGISCISVCALCPVRQIIPKFSRIGKWAEVLCCGRVRLGKVIKEHFSFIKNQNATITVFTKNTSKGHQVLRKLCLQTTMHSGNKKGKNKQTKKQKTKQKKKQKQNKTKQNKTKKKNIYIYTHIHIHIYI